MLMVTMYYSTISEQSQQNFLKNYFIMYLRTAGL